MAVERKPHPVLGTVTPVMYNQVYTQLSQKNLELPRTAEGGVSGVECIIVQFMKVDTHFRRGEEI